MQNEFFIFVNTADVSEYQWPFNFCWDNKLTGGGGQGGEGWWISKRKDIYLALKSTSMVLKRLKSVVFVRSYCSGSTRMCNMNRKSGSVDFIRWLNRLGQIVSYDEISSIKTKLADDQTSQREARKLVPDNIQLSLFVAFVYDNCDHNIESI